MKKGKVVVAWILLIILIILLLGLNYVKFFWGGVTEDYIEEKPVESSSSTAINTALQQIVDNFNNDERISQYEKQNIKMNAVLSNYSIFVSYTDETVITYEFNYQNLNLSINVANEEKNLEKFERVYEILILAVQKRIGNNEDIASYIESFFDGSTQYDGLSRDVVDETLVYQMDITKKLTDEYTDEQVENETTNLDENLSNEDNISEGNIDAQ